MDEQLARGIQQPSLGLQRPAGHQVVQHHPGGPLNLQQLPASHQGMQQPQEVWGPGLQQRQPEPGQQAMQQQRHNVSQTAQRNIRSTSIMVKVTSTPNDFWEHLRRITWAQGLGISVNIEDEMTKVKG